MLNVWVWLVVFSNALSVRVEQYQLTKHGAEVTWGWRGGGGGGVVCVYLKWAYIPACAGSAYTWHDRFMFATRTELWDWGCRPSWIITRSQWGESGSSHPSANQARRCLASEIRRDRMCSRWYGYEPLSRWMAALTRIPSSVPPVCRQCVENYCVSGRLD